jgi:DNA polymerase III alpha subunit
MDMREFIKSPPPQGDKKSVVYFGFSNIKGIGPEAAARVVEHAPYASLEDFIDRHGQAASVLRPLIGLGVFGEPVESYERYLTYVGSARFRDKIIEWRDKTVEKVREMLPTFDLSVSFLYHAAEMVATVDPGLVLEVLGMIAKKVPVPEGLPEVVYSFLSSFGQTAEILSPREAKEVLKKLESLVSSYKKWADSYAEKMANFKPKLDEKWLEQYTSKDVAEAAFYGFALVHKLEQSPSYTGRTFSALRDDETPVGLVEVKVLSVEKRKNKKGGDFYKLHVEDSNSEYQKITVWEEDYERFKGEMVAGTMMRIKVDVPEDFPDYTMSGPQKHMRWKLLPKDKSMDFRIIVMKEVSPCEKIVPTPTSHALITTEN